MFVVVINSTLAYVGSWRGANAFGKLSVLAGDRPLVRKARTGEPVAYHTALRSGRPLPPASA